jgi:dihydrofolate reductase
MSSVTAPRLRCSVFIAISADGYIARSDGGLDWLEAVAQPGEDYGYKAFADSVDVLAIGRNTYDTALAFAQWPYGGKRCVVLTHRPAQTRHNEEFFNGAPRALIDKLSAEGARHVYVDGGHVIRSFLAQRLIDEVTLSIVPVLLGAGIPLFQAGSAEQRLKLLSSHAFETGLVQLRYGAAS